MLLLLMEPGFRGQRKINIFDFGVNCPFNTTARLVYLFYWVSTVRLVSLMTSSLFLSNTIQMYQSCLDLSGAALASAVGPTPLRQVDTGQMMMRSSSRMLRTRNTKYSTNMVTPNIRLILQRQAAMEMMTKRSMRKSSTMAQNKPLEVTVTGSPLWIRMYRSHGTGRLQAERRVVVLSDFTETAIRNVSVY